MSERKQSGPHRFLNVILPYAIVKMQLKYIWDNISMYILLISNIYLFHVLAEHKTQCDETYLRASDFP